MGNAKPLHFIYDDAGQRTSLRRKNGTLTSYSYDAAGRETHIAHYNLGTAATIVSYDYTFDNVGNRTAVLENSGVRSTWTYDNTYQLRREQLDGADSYDVTYTYDPVGNRLTQLENSVTTTYSYDAADELLTEKDNTGTTTFAYDADGNQRVKHLAAVGITTSTWDFENRLDQLAKPDGTIHTFAYDAEGHRVEQRDATSTTKAIWDEDNILLETDGSDVTPFGEDEAGIVGARQGLLQPAVDERAIHGLKFSECLPIEFALDMLRSRLRDIESVRQIMQWPMRFVSFQN